MSEDTIANLGPLAPLVGIWESEEGMDTSRVHGEEKQTPFKERLELTPMGPVVNGPQVMYGLRYNTTAWKLENGEAFHEELGYWMWDAANKQVMRSFMVPRIVNVIAGGQAEADDRNLHMEAEIASETYGVLNNRYLHDSYKTKRYTLDVEIHEDGSWSYFEDTQLWIPAMQEIFHHTDKNRLYKVQDA